MPPVPASLIPVSLIPASLIPASLIPTAPIPPGSSPGSSSELQLGGFLVRICAYIEPPAGRIHTKEN